MANYDRDRQSEEERRQEQQRRDEERREKGFNDADWLSTEKCRKCGAMFPRGQNCPSGC